MSRRFLLWWEHAGSARIVTPLLVIITVLSFGLRLWHIDTEPLHVDELKQVTEVQAPLGEIIELSYRHQQPPLDYLIGKAVVSIGPATDFMQRLPAAVFGAGSVGLIGVVLVRAGMPVAALLAAWFTALFPLLVEFSQYARPYSLPIFMVLAVIAVYQHWHAGDHRRRVLVVFAVAGAAAMLSRATMPLVALAALGAVALWHQRGESRWRDPRRLLRSDPPGLVVLPALALVVWIPSLLVLRANGGRGFLATCCPYDIWDRLAVGVGNIGSFGEQAVQPASLLLLSLAAAGLGMIPAVRRRLRSVRFLWIPMLIAAPGFAMVHALTTRPGQFFARRYMVFLPAGLAIFMGIAIAALLAEAARRDRRLWGAAVVVVAGGVVAASVGLLGAVRDQAVHQDLADWKATGEYIAETEQSGDVIVSIDTRPFRREFRFGFMAAPRYYQGASPAVTPDDVIGTPALVTSALRYHFVLFVPKMSPGWSVPPDWTTVRFSNMIIATTPILTSGEERIDAWWTLAGALRPDVAVRTQIAGAALEMETGLALHPWRETVEIEAEELGQLPYATELLTTASAP